MARLDLDRPVVGIWGLVGAFIAGLVGVWAGFIYVLSVPGPPWVVAGIAVLVVALVVVGWVFRGWQRVILLALGVGFIMGAAYLTSLLLTYQPV